MYEYTIIINDNHGTRELQQYMGEYLISKGFYVIFIGYPNERGSLNRPQIQMIIPQVTTIVHCLTYSKSMLHGQIANVFYFVERTCCRH